MNSRRALLLDKDGVISVDLGYVCTAARTRFMGGIFDLCRAVTQRGCLNVVVTNQAGIARGYYTEPDFLAYMAWVRQEFEARGAQLDAVYYCPHHPLQGVGAYRRDCDCRKPKPGMILTAARELRLDLAGSVLLGDSDSDMAAGEAAGVGACVKSPPPDAGSAPVLNAAVVQKVLDALTPRD